VQQSLRQSALSAGCVVTIIIEIPLNFISLPRVSEWLPFLHPDPNNAEVLTETAQKGFEKIFNHCLLDPILDCGAVRTRSTQNR
jgi:hypothetical protein